MSKQEVGVGDKPVDEMDEGELREELVIFRDLWTRLPDDIKTLTKAYGSLVALLKRNYKRDIGILFEVKYEPIGYVLGQVDVEYDPITYERVKETRTRVLSSGVVMGIDFILEQEPLEKDKPLVET